MATLKYRFATSLFSIFLYFSWIGALKKYGGWPMGPGMMGAWGIGWLGMIFMMTFWSLLIMSLVFLIKWLIQTTGKGRRVFRTDDPILSG
jgi:hypothetical protein